MKTPRPTDAELVRNALGAVTHALEMQTSATLQIVEAFTRPPAPFFPPELVAAVAPLFAQLGQVLAVQMQPRAIRPGPIVEQHHAGANGDARRAPEA